MSRELTELIMVRQSLNGDDAYKWMRKRSMDSRKTLLEVAEAILLANELYE